MTTSTPNVSTGAIADAVTFVDTNVLVYAYDASEAIKQPIAQAVLEELWSSGGGVLSTQVLQEFYAVATSKLKPPMRAPEAREIVSLYSTWPVVLIEPSLILTASRLREEHRLSFWDALIVEAARVIGAGRLLSEDLADGGSYGGVRVENPFRPPHRVAEHESDAGYGVGEGAVRRWDDRDLLEALRRYERESADAGMTRNAVHSYWDYARRFLAWRTGDYRPRGAADDGRPVPSTPVSADDLTDQAGEYARAIQAAGREQATIDTYYRHAMFLVRWLRGDFKPGSRLR